VKNPRWSTPQPTRNSTVAASAATTAIQASAGRDQLACRAITRSRLLRPPPSARRQDDEGDEREEPGDVEVEPVRQGQLEPHEHGGGQSCELQGRFPLRDEVARERAHHDEGDNHLLEPAEVRDAGCVVLAPAPDRERRVAADLPAEGSVPEDPRRMGGIRLEQEAREGGEGRGDETSC